MKNNIVLDAISEAIEETIKHFIDIDVYYHIAPYLSTEIVDASCPFFADNRITIDENSTNSDDLKTISYLAPFQRSRVAYNPKNIDYYLRTLGHIKHSETASNILCFMDGECGNENRNITYEEWLKIP